MATLQEIIQYSKANPNTDYAKKAAKLIQNGDFDAQAQKEGIDLSWAGRPSLQSVNQKQQVIDQAKNVQTEVGANTAVLPAKTAVSPEGKQNLGFVDALKTIPNAAGDILNLVKGATYDTAKRIIYDIPKEAIGLLQDTGGDPVEAMKNVIKSVPEATLKTLWGIVPQSAKEVINTNALSEIPSQFQALAKESGGYANAFSNLVKAIPDSLTPAMLQYANQLDKARQSFENHPVNEVLGYLGMKTLAENPKIAIDALKLTTDFAKNPIKNTTEALSPAVETLKNGVKSVTGNISPTPTIDQLVGRVAQGETTDIPSFKSGLESLDTSKVKTYSDLQKTASEKIAELSKQQDQLLSKDPTPRKVQQLATEVKSGDATIFHNYVLDAVEQLKQYYTKTNNVSELAKINEYINKLDVTKGKGLTIQEVNDIARLHGQDLNGYNANGELASGLTKQAAENTRVGLKKTVRSLIKDPASQALDSEISNLYSVKDLSQTMAEKVNTLTQKLQQRNVFQKLGSVLGQFGKVAGVSDLVQKIIGFNNTPGATTLSPVEIEATLAKNLKRIDAALKKNDAGFVQDMTEIIRDNQ